MRFHRRNHAPSFFIVVCVLSKLNYQFFFFWSLLPLQYWCVQLAVWQVLCFSLSPPPPPVSQCYKANSAQTQWMSSTLKNCGCAHLQTSLTLLPPLSPRLSSIYIEFRMRDFKTHKGRIHDWTQHQRPFYWTVCALLRQTMPRFWQTVEGAESIYLLCRIWMVILKCTPLALTAVLCRAQYMSVAAAKMPVLHVF